MGESVGPCARLFIVLSGLAMLALGIVGMKANFLGGLIIFCLLFLVWGSLSRLIVFAFTGGGTSVEFEDFQANLRNAGYPALDEHGPEDPSVFPRAEESSEPGSRIIPRRQNTARRGDRGEAMPRVRYGFDRQKRGESEDGEFADFLRSSPFL